MASDNTQRYFFIVLFIALIVLVFFIIRPFIVVILTSMILAYIFFPLYKLINRKLRRKNLSALITISLAILIITIPLIFAMNALAKEARVNYLLIKQRIFGDDIFQCENDTPFCMLSSQARKFLAEPQVKYYVDTATQRATNFLVESISDFLFSIPAIIFNIFIMIFIMFFLFRDGAEMMKKLEDIILLRKLHRKRIIRKFDNVMHAVVFGHIVVSFIQGAVGALGLFILGVKSPILLGLLMALLAIIPIVGPPLVWLPIAVLMIFDGYLAESNWLIIKGIILILYGAFVIGLIDNLLKPKIIGDKAKVHPVLVLLGVLGGLAMFGFVGIVIGPVVLAVFMTFLQIYQQEKGAIFG